jgi:hypothetical protein
MPFLCTTGAASAKGFGNLYQQIVISNTGWASKLGFGANSSASMTLDSDNNIYITGQSNVIFKISPNGTVVWQRILQQSGTGFRDLQISSIQVLSSSLISVAGGTSNGSISFLPALSFVNVNGNGSSSLYFAAATYDYIDSQTVSSAGSIYVGYNSSSIYNFFRVFNGVVVARKKYSSARFSLKIIGNGAGDTVYLGSSAAFIPSIIKLDSNLSVLWKLSGPFVFNKVLELNGFVYAIGYDTNAYDGAILKIDASTAAIVWAKKYSFGVLSSALSSVAADAYGNIYISGNTSPNKKVIVLKIDSNGNLIWSKSILIRGLSSTQYTISPSIVVNNTDNTFCVQFAINTSSLFCFMLSVPNNGTLTGSYTVGGTTFDYSDNSVSLSSISPSFTSPAISFASIPINDSSFGLSVSSQSLTYSKISIP